MSADLQFRIGAELSEIKGALAGLRKDFAAVNQAAQSSGKGKAFGGVESGARSALGAVGRLVAGIATVATAIKLIGEADELNTLNARLRLVTDSAEELAQAQQAVFDIAQRARAGLSTTADLYLKIANSTKDAKVGQAVLQQVTETILKLGQISGASGASFDAALTQLGQGLGSGTLRGEELNSVLEQTPALADAIAKGMGITRAELRKYGEDGKITSEQVIKALQSQRDEVERQFAQLPLTVGQAVTLLKNAGLQLLGSFNDATGATSGLASVIKDLADYLGSDEAAGAMVQFAATWSAAIRETANDAREAARIIEEATSGITSKGEGLFGFLIQAFRDLPINIRAAIKIATIEIAAFVDTAINGFTGVGRALRAIFDPNLTVAQVRESVARAQKAINDARLSSITSALDERDKALADAEAARQQAEQRRKAARDFKPSTSAGTFKTKQSDEERRKAEALRKAQLDAEEKLLKDSSQRQISILQELYEDAKIAAADYYSRRQALELEALDRSIAVERQRAAAGGADKVKALAEIELLERAKADVQRRIERERAADARRLADEVAQAQADELESQGRLADAARIRLEAKFRDTLKRLAKDSEEAKLVQRLIDNGVAKARFDELRAQAERFIADLERRRADIERRVNAGAITPEQGRQEEQTAQAQAVANLGPVNEQVQQLAGTLKDPALVEAANALGDAIARIGQRSATGLSAAIIDLQKNLVQMQQTFAQATVNAGVDALTGFFNDLASGSKSAGEALRDFVRGFVASMATLAARAVATVIVLKALEAYSGIPASTLASLANVGTSANTRHTGGMAGHGPRRQVPSWIFAGAPRFHNGGDVGLRPGEVPAILQVGERVQSRAEVAAERQGGGPGAGVRIINVTDPSVVGEFMESAAGERVILNTIERNRGAVRQKLA